MTFTVLANGGDKMSNKRIFQLEIHGTKADLERVIKRQKPKGKVLVQWLEYDGQPGVWNLRNVEEIQ